MRARFTYYRADGARKLNQLYLSKCGRFWGLMLELRRGSEMRGLAPGSNGVVLGWISAGAARLRPNIGAQHITPGALYMRVLTRDAWRACLLQLHSSLPAASLPFPRHSHGLGRIGGHRYSHARCSIAASHPLAAEGCSHCRRRLGHCRNSYS